MDLNNLGDERNLIMSKSCNNIITKKVDFRINKTDIKTNNNSGGIFNNEENKNNNLSNIDYNNKNDDNLIKIIRKNSYYKKIIPNNKVVNHNSLKMHSLKKNFSNKNINYNSFNYSMNKIPNLIYEANKNNSNNKVKKKYKNKNIIQFKKSFNKDIINKSTNKNERIISDNNNSIIKEVYINKNKLKLSPDIKNSEKKSKRNNFIEFKNNSFFLSDATDKNKQNKLLYVCDEKSNKSNNNYINNTIVNQISNNKLKPENIKGLYSKKNKLIEINKNTHNKNPSNLSLGNISPIFLKEIRK